MRRLRIILWTVLTGIVILVGYFALRGYGVLGASSLVRASVVPAGDQEIAWIQTATNAASWERLVSAVRQVERGWPGLRVDYRGAFPEHTAAVPELALSFDGVPGKLWVRWYKLTSDAGHPEWIAELARRQPPPLAIIGGGSSDRARDLARALRNEQGWQGDPPILLLTTATADRVYLADDDRVVPLVNIHRDRTFRFCFTNSQMAEAVRDFVWSRPYLRPYHSAPTLMIGSAPAAAQGGLASALPLLAIGPYVHLPQVHILEWQDDPYSLDLSAQFREVLSDPRHQPTYVLAHSIPYSVGSYAQPNPQEVNWIEWLTKMQAYSPDQRELLVLPTVDRPARRILRGLTAALPKETRNLVAVTGDSISFNIIYRDRNVAWNVQDMPVSLVLFCHQDPVQWEVDADTDLANGHASATDDLLLNADIVRVVLEAAFGSRGGVEPLLSSSAELARRMREREPAFFQPDGNRVGGSGEYVVCLRPRIKADRVLPSADIEVWTRMGDEWLLVRGFRVRYEE